MNMRRFSFVFSFLLPVALVITVFMSQGCSPKADKQQGDDESTASKVEPGKNLASVTPGEMISISAGTVKISDMMGDWSDDKVPLCEVTLSAYEIGKYEVTNQEYANILNWANEQGYLDKASSTAADAYGVQLLDVGGYSYPISWDGSQFTVETRDGHSMINHPVVAVTWYGAAAYCNWLSEKEGLTPCYDTSSWACNFENNGYHLPTEAQWESAAAWDGSNHYLYGNGSNSINCDTANFHDGSNHSNPLKLTKPPYTSPVGYYSGASSPAGCYDMSGNVEEWCNDWAPTEFKSPAANNPVGPNSGTKRLARGGSWASFAFGARTSNRTPIPPETTGRPVDDRRGFRVARTL